MAAKKAKSREKGDPPKKRPGLKKLLSQAIRDQRKSLKSLELALAETEHAVEVLFPYGRRCPVVSTGVPWPFGRTCGVYAYGPQCTYEPKAKRGKGKRTEPSARPEES